MGQFLHLNLAIIMTKYQVGSGNKIFCCHLNFTDRITPGNIAKLNSKEKILEVLYCTCFN